MTSWFSIHPSHSFQAPASFEAAASTLFAESPFTPCMKASQMLFPPPRDAFFFSALDFLEALLDFLSFWSSVSAAPELAIMASRLPLFFPLAPPGVTLLLWNILLKMLLPPRLKKLLDFFFSSCESDFDSSFSRLSIMFWTLD